MAYNPQNPNGQATMANSSPVAIASDQSAIPITDNAGSVTVDAPVATPVFVRLSDGAAAIATLPVSLASVPSHAVTNAGTFAVQSTNQANNGVDIGDVTINNAGGASAVNIQDGGNSITVDGTVAVSNASFPVTDNAGSLTVDAPVTTPVFVRLSDGSSAISALPITDNAGSITVDNGGTFAVQAAQSGTWNITNVSGTVSLPTGAATAAKQPALGTAGTPSADVITIQGASTGTAVNVSNVPVTSGGLTTYHLASAGTTNATNLKASAGQVYGWFIYNSNAAYRKVAFHNTAGTPTAGASVFFSLVIPPGSGANVFTDTGIAFSTGIAITTTTGLADSDTVAVAANDLIINIFYK